MSSRISLEKKALSLTLLIDFKKVLILLNLSFSYPFPPTRWNQKGPFIVYPRDSIFGPFSL